ncbi:rod-binding protein [Parasphingorhabdus cellanae]|uniref:Rod-binding protein n=1 Tax=Parasphingorhabdus cellanae TaxID=2806553 RepID=A0ABX7T4J5_9SPHN|nr:rod-binding protein [Parasphingorhabdus cellanae]QTD56499.1 rod-binding protein [Parasphingorhabdus cellanae]
MTQITSSNRINSRPDIAMDQQKLKQAAQAFEAIFVRNMIGAMRSANLGEDLMGNNGSDQFRTMMDDRIADQMAEHDGLGIADILIAQWKDKI